MGVFWEGLAAVTAISGLLAAGTATSVRLAHRAALRQRALTWDRLVRSLELAEAREFGTRQLEAVVGGIRIVVDGSSSWNVRICAEVPDAGRMRIVRVDLEDHVGHPPQSTVSTGDPALDRAAWISGEPSVQILARMDHHARSSVLGAILHGGALEQGWWTASCVTDAPHVEGIAWILARAARATAGSSEPIASRLMRIAAADPHPNVRYNVLQRLVSEYELDLGWLSERAADPDWRVSVTAAWAAGEAGRRTLLRHLRRSGPEARIAAAVALASLSPDDALPDVENVLVRALSDPSTSVVRALATCGTARTLPALRRAAGRLRNMGSTRTQLLLAIEAIEGRLGVERGSLSLAEPGDGGLGLADPPTGEPGSR